jgi:hypothetical protein
MSSSEVRKDRHESAAAHTAPPRELIDPDGEGIYLHEDQGFPGVLMRAALLFFGDMREWRNVEQRTVWMRPSEDGETWGEVGLGRFPFGWKLWLPRSRRPVLFVYCTPNPEAL